MCQVRATTLTPYQNYVGTEAPHYGAWLVEESAAWHRMPTLLEDRQRGPKIVLLHNGWAGERAFQLGSFRPQHSENFVFSKILIANRGEIAVRIAQTCREMGIATVAIYSSADEHALHRRVADEAYCVGPPPAPESYLRADAILEAAKESGAEAVHPGYGFLAENSNFARAVLDAGLVWIGPPPDVISLMGDKVAAKRLASTSGVPIVPGYIGDEQDLDRLLTEAERIGFPIMIKAAAGGGGRGMRAVLDAQQLAAALEAASREARSTFGDGRVFLEKLLVNPRHIEIQVLADTQGNAVHLGERECSLQRRHQKVVEEAPSPVITADLRAAMGDSALRLARAAGYVGAGTVEFLFSGDRYFFLEMNTRIQVEHPVTELITGLDLVRLQIEIAAGSPLPFDQLDVRPRGHAVEARIYAENAGAGFLPSSGKLQLFRPPLGPGIRNDVGVFEGAEVSPYYDSMLAKLVVHAETRSEAVSRLQDALKLYRALGVTTNLDFLRWIATHPDFRAGRIDVGFVERNWTAPTPDLPPDPLMAAAVFDLTGSSLLPVSDGRGAHRHDPWHTIGGWRQRGIARQLIYEYGGRPYEIKLARAGNGAWRFELGDSTREVQVRTDPSGAIILGGGSRSVECTVVRVGDALAVELDGTVYHLVRPGPSTTGLSSSADATEDAALSAPMPGTVVKVAVRPGQRVSTYETLVVLEAMKMEHAVLAPHDGVVKEVLFREGDLVPAGSPVVKLEHQ